MTVEATEQIRRVSRPAHQLVLALLCLLALVLAGCGGDDRQDANAPSGDWNVTVVEWEFAKDQPLGTPQNFILKVRNEDDRTIPNLIATISGMRTKVYQPGAASEVRPIWLNRDVDYSQFTAYNSALDISFNLGTLKKGETGSFVVNLTPLRVGEHEVGYRLAPDLFGTGRIIDTATGEQAADNRMVTINPTPVFDETTFDD